MLDLLIKNAEVFDGTGAPATVMHVGVKDGKIVSVTRNSDLEAVVVIDGTGLSLAPGFIDAHTHSDTQIYQNPSRWDKLKQGITTEIGGQCGLSPAPCPADAPKDFVEYNTTTNNTPRYATFREAMDALDTMKLGCHQASFVGHHSIRGSVMGMANRPATPKEIDRMCGLAEEAMQSGALGLSTGLVYAPGVYSTRDEVTAIAKVAGRYGGKYTTHMRDEGDRLIESVEEAIRVSAEAGVPLNISHMKAMFPANYGKIATVLEMIDKENARGAHITFDVYPYEACSATILSTLPPSYLSHGMDWLMEHLEGEENIAALRKAIYEPTEQWENPVAKIGIKNQLIGNAPNAPELVGMRISEYAAAKGLDDIAAYAEVIRISGGYLQDIRFAMNEENIEQLYRHPMCMVGSDGLYRGGNAKVHVRAFATCTKYLGHYIREKKILSFAEGIRRLTGMPADEYSLTGKGYIREGYDADLVLFNKDTIRATATYTDPYLPNEGIHMVFMGGKAVVVDNELTGVLEGKKLLYKR